MWRVQVAPALGLAGLLGALVLILSNLSDLVGGSSVLARVIVSVLVAAFVAGAAVGTRVGTRIDDASVAARRT